MKNNLEKLASPLFFLGLLILGLITYKDYGVSFDEPAQRLIGVTNLNHIAHKFNLTSIINNESLAQFPKKLDQITDRDYGVIFELPAAYMEHIFDLKQERDIYHARHLLTFLFFLAGVFAVYRMAQRRFNDWRIGLLAATFLILSPRIFADAFYNDKDLVFLSVFAIAMNTSISFLLKPSLKTALINGIACAIAIDARIMAVIIPVLASSLMGIGILKSETTARNGFFYLIIFLLSCIGFTILFWPFLWDSPINNFLQAFENMARFRHNPYLIFMGESVRASNLPWYYIPFWIGITTPIIYLILFLIGAIETIKSLFKNHYKIWSTKNELQDLIFLTLFLGPIFAAIFLNSILYNGWRHLYFVYPAFIVIAIHGLIYAWRLAKKISIARPLLLGIISFSCIHTAYWMFQHHPLQNLYFNQFSGDWNRKFEVDYWGLANKQALEKILINNPSATVVAWPGYAYQWPGGWQLPFTQNLKILDANDQSRIRIPETKNESIYIITSHQGNDGFNTDSYQHNYRYTLIDEVLIDSKPIYSIFKKVENPQLPKLNSNQVLKFAKNQLGIHYLRHDWQYPEEWGTWTASQSAKIFLPLAANKPDTVKFKFRALVSDKLAYQNIEVWVNGQFVKSHNAYQARDNELVITVPKADSNLEVELRLPNATKPKDLGINKDERLLAIGLESIELK
jgi:hypothetical protein